MTDMRATIRIMDAIREADLQEASNYRTRSDSETGILVIGPSSTSLDAIRGIVEELDYRLEIMDADRTNLNDLEVFDSPMRELARHAFSSEKTYVFVLRGWVSEMAKDPRISNFRRCYGGAGIVIILSEDGSEAPEQFVTCDISVGAPR